MMNPIGVQPEWLWREARIIALREAIKRYIDADLGHVKAVKDWAEEHDKHIGWVLRYRNAKIE